ncbi:hypothetical protein HPB51_011061 [Rhipicephalus microplus]|uniref:HAT C-terminal dimerisation domain-containing protein n=1 Tax=Rhipicephalus microplus TaxID=6941 RepID=A0A9J6E8P1_RHIMP|nr:hypothetical protein HPB51_011061 [Rhipicephalus microplus]
MKEYRMTAAGAPAKDQSMVFDFVHRTDPLLENKTQALNAKVAAMVALDLQPYSFVEDRGFKELMAEAVPNYRLPSRTTLSRTLVPRLFDDTRKKVKDELSSAIEGGTSAVTFTRDSWTSRANESYLASHDAISNTPSIDRLCKKARHIVGHYKHSSSAQKRLDEYQKKMGKDPLRLVQDVDTRWNSQYLMLSRLLDLKEAVSVELATSSNSIDGLCSAEWKETLEYLDALKPLYDATVITSADKYPSLSTQIPIIFCMLSCLRNFSGTTCFHKELARSLNTRFPLYTEDKETGLDMFLDPRFKSTVFRNKKQKLVWLKDQVLQDVALCPAVEVVQPAAKVQEPQECVQPSSDVWSAFDNLANSQVASTPLSTSEWEIKAYSQEALLKKDSDPCDWWWTVVHLQIPQSGKALPQVLAHTNHFSSKRACLFSGRGETELRELLKYVRMEVEDREGISLVDARGHGVSRSPTRQVSQCFTKGICSGWPRNESERYFLFGLSSAHVTEACPSDIIIDQKKTRLESVQTKDISLKNAVAISCALSVTEDTQQFFETRIGSKAALNRVKDP